MTHRSGRDIITVAASAGGLLPLRRFLAGLPAGLPASVLAVLHIPATGGQALPRILDRAGPLPAATAVDGEKLEPGRIYVAPADRHLLVADGQVRLSRGPRQNGVRPAADPLFRSAALYGGPRTVAVVLSGTLDDAALGSATVERHGGVVVVQDPAEAAYPGMPASALVATRHARALPVDQLAGLVVRLVTEEAAPGTGRTGTGRTGTGRDPDLANDIGVLLNERSEGNVLDRPYSGFICPDCGGPLYSSDRDTAATYDCVVGHSWSPESLLEGQAVEVERAMWLAVRSLDERARLTGRLAEEAQQRGRKISARRFREAANEACQAADRIREVAAGLTAAGHELDGPSGDGRDGPSGR